jgi:radical SAM protein with 4Fe4S-binding SPASM domain
MKDISLYLKKSKDILLKPQICELPIYIQFESTTHCNLKCKMCVRNENIKNPKHLSFDTFKNIYDQVKPLKITLSGQGEPLLNKELNQMIKYARENGSSVMIPSNGTLILKNNLANDLVESGLNVLKISIDAANKDTYIKVRGQDCFNDIIEGIKKIQEIKKEKKSLFPEIRLDIVVLEENINEIPDIISLAKFLNVNTVFFRAVQTQGLDEERKNTIGKNINFDKMLEKIKYGLKLSKDLNINTNLDEFLRDFSNYKSIYIKLDAEMQNKVCLLPYLQCFVSIDGEVAPCCALYCNEGVSVGNVFENNFIDVWNGKKMQNIRKSFAQKNNNFKVCKDCIPRSLSVLLKMSKMLPGFIKT